MLAAPAARALPAHQSHDIRGTLRAGQAHRASALSGRGTPRAAFDSAATRARRLSPASASVRLSSSAWNDVN
jgi:hypothetical protein